VREIWAVTIAPGNDHSLIWREHQECREVAHSAGPRPGIGIQAR
jgi:hypothetical protein